MTAGNKQPMRVSPQLTPCMFLLAWASSVSNCGNPSQLVSSFFSFFSSLSLCLFPKREKPCRNPSNQLDVLESQGGSPVPEKCSGDSPTHSPPFPRSARFCQWACRLYQIHVGGGRGTTGGNCLGTWAW
ncbi:uncharacterized protein F4807DRAFT_428890 [Annulohypoxylon truncatum]|uniref:uncharacterized protein n=1 Tax=Annulohypoxylon truncatum TaxID=327061 RepID=UPI0020085AA6|nr:uncharacterized protein F4807DRAFT_428890 [Annulohypoxylon truncatum]KAI1209096.1 hypothetical protein F4807DRAFT_428890 [Annulohypoxylon truncatum]